MGNGFYQIAANAVDASTLGPLIVHATAATCDPTDDIFDVVSYDPTAFAPVTVPSGPDAVRALDLINDAFEIIGVRSQGEVLSAADTSGALRRLNQLLAQWSLMSLTVPYTARETFTLLAATGTPTNPYTVGVGGDLNTTRPVMIEAVGVVDASGYETPRGLYTEAGYQSIVNKTLTGTTFTGAYYQPTYTSGLGSLYVYPIATTLDTLVLYRPANLSQFGTLTAPYDLPPGAADAITYELARRLARPYGRDWSADLAYDAGQYLAIYQRANTRMVDLGFDTALVGGRPWNILTGP